MISPKWSLTVVCTALVAALAIGVDWVAAELLGIGSATARWWLLSINLGLVGIALAMLLDRERSLKRNATTQLEALSRKVAGLERSRGEYKRHAERLEAQTRRVRSVLSALGEPVLVIDKRDEVVLTNSSADRLLAFDSQSAENRALENIVRCQQLVELLADTRRHRAFTEQSREIELVGDDGTPHWYRVTARNIPTRPGDSDPDGTSQGAVALLHDISDQRRLQKQNAELVSAVSHELKTPLAGIKAYVELLADGDAEDDQAQREFLRIISVETQRLECLVDDLVDLARIEADLAGGRRAPCPIAPLVDEALAAVRAEAREKQLAIEIDCQLPAANYSLTGDRELLVQAVKNLLTNAIRYTPSGGRVVCRTRQAAGGVAIEVEDTGVGLSAEDCRRVFEKFYRVPAQRGLASGAGLGLPLVKHIVEDVHAGRVEVESSPGEGSLFRIWLPAAADMPDANTVGTEGRERP